MSGERDWALNTYEFRGPGGLSAERETMDLLEWIGGADAAMRHAYWKWNDLRGAFMIGVEIMDRAEASAELVILGAAKPAIANLSLWTWPGWGDDRGRPTPEMMEIGARAGDLNLDLARRLDKPPIALSRALWAIGAHRMVHDPSGAARVFEEAAEKAKEAEADVDALMNQCYAWGCQKHQNLQGGLADLGTMGEDGSFYAEQIRTALRIFQLSPED